MEKSITQDMSCREGEKISDYVAKYNKGHLEMMDIVGAPSNPSGDDLPFKAVNPPQNE